MVIGGTKWFCVASSVALLKRRFILTDELECALLATMNEREYNRMKSEIEAEYRRKLDALDLVWKMSNANRNGTQVANPLIGKGQLLKAVRQALPSIRGDFTLHDIENRIRVDNPTLAATLKRPSLSSALKRLVKDGVIALVSVGAGKRPSKYRMGSVASE